MNQTRRSFLKAAVMLPVAGIAASPWICHAAPTTKPPGQWVELSRHFKWADNLIVLDVSNFKAIRLLEPARLEVITYRRPDNSILPTVVIPTKRMPPTRAMEVDPAPPMPAQQVIGRDGKPRPVMTIGYGVYYQGKFTINRVVFYRDDPEMPFETFQARMKAHFIAANGK